MKQRFINDVLQEMLPHLNNAQCEKLQEVLRYLLFNYEITENRTNDSDTQTDLVELFIAAKKIEGCSEKSLKYYKKTITMMLESVNKNIKHIVTDDIRTYLTDYQENKNVGKVTIDNIRRILSSFFSWLEDEDYILKSPVRRIHKVKTAKVVKDIYSDETLELMRDNCTTKRDLAMIDLLASSGMRVGDADGKISLNQQKPSKHAGLRRFGPEKFLQRNNEFMKERPIFYKKPIKTEKDFSTWLRCFYYTTKAVITEYIYF